MYHLIYYSINTVHIWSYYQCPRYVTVSTQLDLSAVVHLHFPSFPQASTQSWPLTSIWRGRSATLWSRHICPASWRSSSPRSPSGSIESQCQPGLSLVSLLFYYFKLCSHFLQRKKTGWSYTLYSPSTYTLICIRRTASRNALSLKQPVINQTLLSHAWKQNQA